MHAGWPKVEVPKEIATAAVLGMLIVPAWASEPESKASEPANSDDRMVLSETEMDGVTAGDTRTSPRHQHFETTPSRFHKEPVFHECHRLGAVGVSNFSIWPYLAIRMRRHWVTVAAAIRNGSCRFSANAGNTFVGYRR